MKDLATLLESEGVEHFDCHAVDAQISEQIEVLSCDDDAHFLEGFHYVRHDRIAANIVQNQERALEQKEGEENTSYRLISDVAKNVCNVRCMQPNPCSDVGLEPREWTVRLKQTEADFMIQIKSNAA